MRKIVMIGDSTMHFNKINAYPQTGWGQELDLYTKEDVIVLNFAENGRSTKSFIKEGLLDKALSNLDKGDVLICQFGHNDEKIEDILRGTNKDYDFLDNLSYIHDKVIEKGADIVYATSISRRKFENGICVDTHKGYPQAMFKWANEKGYTCVDLNSLTLDLYNKLGEEETKKFHMIFEPNKFVNYPEGKCDNSHLSPWGAICISQLFVNAIKNTNSSLKDFFDYDFKEIDLKMLID